MLDKKIRLVKLDFRPYDSARVKDERSLLETIFLAAA
jgi:hypothetical protein